MSKVAVMMSAERADGPMSSHFGKAEWIMIADTETASNKFVKNDAMNGRGAAGTVIGEGCSDVVVVDIGDGALGHLQSANIRAWVVPEPVAGVEALNRFKAGQLSAVPSTPAATRHGSGHGCCCGHGGTASSCCRG
jgi:predicted Fe-Mo cluster-binding NifX family protein